MRELAQIRVRYGYRRIGVLLQREGWSVGPHVLRCVYGEEGLVLRPRRPRRHGHRGAAATIRNSGRR